MKAIVSSLLVLSGTLMAGDLPQLSTKPWVGWFSGNEGKSVHFGVKMNGRAALMPVSKKGVVVSPRSWFDIVPSIEELLPGGKVVTKEAQSDGWEAISESSTEAETISYRGTVTGGARFEVHFEIDGNEIRGGGKVIDKGELTKNPIRFAVRIKVPNVYPHQKDEKELEKIVKRDRIELQMLDGKKQRLNGLEPVTGTEVTGDGVRSARVDLDGFDGARLNADAGEAGSFRLVNKAETPLYRGFYLTWSPDEEKDPDGKARFELKFK